MKHTKGPWKYAYTDEDESRCGWMIARVIEMEQPTQLLAPNVRPVAFVADADKSREDIAALISAAPDLYEACKAAAAHFEGTDAPLGEMLRAAIAKAEGKGE